jgi:predicted flap endonuclease-1-like 5' DNA nuclease
MVELVHENWIFLVVALLVGLLVAWWLFASRRTRVELGSKAPTGASAQRNQALIDAPAAVVPDVPPPTPEALAGVGEAVAASVMTQHPSHEVVFGDDDLTRIKGLGPKLAEQLRALGITSFAQIAAWDDDEIDRVDALLGRFQGRIRRDAWTDQARFLAENDTAGYEAKFGKL